MPKTSRRIRQRLEEERDHLEELIRGLADRPVGDGWTGTGGRTGDLVDAASERAAQTDAASLAAAVAQRLERVESALARVADGSYGTCEVCGEPITAERLEVLPYTTVCVDDGDEVLRLP